MTLVDDQRQDYLVNFIDNESVKKQSGGSAANTVIAVKQFGGKSFYSCQVANDDFGHFYINDLRNAGVDTNLNGFELPEGKTGKCLVMVTPDADRTMNTFLGISSDLDETVIREDALGSSKYLYLEGYLVTSEISVNAMLKSKYYAEKHGVKTSITLSDPSIVQYFRSQFQQVIGNGVDMIFCNEEEALAFTETSNLEEAKEKLKLVAKHFAITFGDRGALIYDGHDFIKVAPVPVKAIDSNGAGDMFAGSFLFGITNGFSYEQAGEIASLAAAKVVSKFGPRLEQEQIQKILNK
jgi:sugar/nucleoside kinase (ribokinase family)